MWGFADWMPKMSVQPNAYLSTPPDERWGLKWSTDLNFDLESQKTRIKEIMANQIKSVRPIPVVYMIDHSKPFNDFKKLPDARQAQITQFFADLTRVMGANFVFRTYYDDKQFLGNKTKEVIKNECHARKTFCPSNQ